MRQGGYWAAGLLGAGAGAALGYFLDPQSGGRRRSRVRGLSTHVLRTAQGLPQVVFGDLWRRARGRAHEARARLSKASVPDAVLVERVRAHLGRCCSHPGAIAVRAEDGVVTLEGPIFRAEAHRVLSHVRRVAGVRGLVDELSRHVLPDVPALQGGERHRAERFELLQNRWAPGPRLLALGVGVGAAGAGFVRGTRGGLLLAGAGAALGARAATNLPLRRLFGVGAGARAVDVVKELHIAAPVEEVFRLFRAFERFPRYMPHVLAVKRAGDGLWRWRVRGPAGVPFEWDAELVKLVPNELLAWRSVPAAIVRNEGVVRFEPHEHGGTRLHIKLSYNPPAGALGHAVARLLGADPRHELDADLLRLKSLLEHGRATAKGHTVTREELGV